MIFVSSLSVLAKNALKTQVMQSNQAKIISQMSIDPDTTRMDTVLLGPKDYNPVKVQAMQDAIDNRHPDVCVIYIYTKDKEADFFECEYKKQVKKLNKQAIIDVIEEFVGEHSIRQGKQRVTSGDFVVPESDMIGEVSQEEEEQVQYQRFEEEFPEEKPVVSLEKPPVEEEQTAGKFDLNFDDLEVPAPEQEPLDTMTETPDPLFAPIEELPKIPEQESLEEQLERVNNFYEWPLFQEKLNKDSVVKQLIHENSEYAGLIQTLDVLDKEIQAIWNDKALSHDQKFEKIKEIGLRRSVVRAASNSINVEKVISIISTIVLSAKRTVDDKISGLDAAIYKITTDKSLLADTSYIDKAISERAKVQLELMEMARGLIDLYKSIDNFVVAEIADLDKRLPSANQFINDMVKPIGTQIFTPQNTAQLANKLLQALQKNTIVVSQIDDAIQAVIAKLFELCDKDEEIMRYQQNKILMMSANRVEDVVIVDSLLKNILRLYVGADNSGRSATAITWCGLLSRRQNSLLIDLTGRSKFREYGITPVDLDTFMKNRIEQQFLCVESNHILGPDELQEFVNQLKSRLNYYPFVNVILAPEDTEGLDQLSNDAKCVHYITDCSNASLGVMRDVIQKHQSQNIARKLITIEPPVSPLMIADAVRIDPTICQCVTIPNVPAIRACAIKHDRPFEYNDVARIFEEAFR